jgi:hypothetical protein
MSWRKVSTDAYLSTDRLPVPGGWLYRTVYIGREVSTTFVPDSGREWEAAYSTYQRVTQQEGR